MSKQESKVEPSAFSRAVFNAAIKAEKIVQTNAERMRVLVREHWGDAMPDFEQYRTVLKELAALAKAKGLASDQTVRKPFCAAVRELYGSLPVSMEPAAVEKRLQRERDEQLLKQAKAAAEAAAVTAGAPKGETQSKVPTEAEQIESYIARVGPIKVYDALVRILAAGESTAGLATHLDKFGGQLKKVLAPAA